MGKLGLLPWGGRTAENSGPTRQVFRERSKGGRPHQWMRRGEKPRAGEQGVHKDVDGNKEGAGRPRAGGCRVSAVLPALNEAENIGWVLSRLPECVDEVLVVDGRSVDATIEVALEVRP